LSALIVFGSPRSGGGEGSTGSEAVRVVQEPADVIKALSATKSGFANFQLDNEAGTNVWVNRETVRMVREVQPKEDKA
jgi:hypothetical protein